MKTYNASTFIKQATICLAVLIFTQAKAHAQVTSFIIDSSKFKMELLPMLDTIYKDDQSYRFELASLTRSNASPSKLDSVRNIIKEKDEINLKKINAILTKYGWLGPQEVGMNGSQSIFLVIQHADLDTQKKYLSLVQQAEKEGKTLSSNLAILEDRIAMREGRKQYYGSQGFKDKVTGISYIYPIVDIDQLDQRRKQMGMPPMATYVKNWNLEDYKKKLPEIEKIVKAQNIR
ncbi:DUF6624 domain-containing protein [Pedobacter chitinilyticus]|uniref:DUF541 domain-containing protein n=1 Tax=Pedobacter chitinilyticus TaxID=2233776 RepID=A0A3S3PY01_9SPHI|nr:DUF6624 domain-containing protein [Pedobacter chitinilyticus]RWU05436.1 hypothetical protein DPV69_14880 [Pedobacter chitinilyticus]